MSELNIQLSAEELSVFKAYRTEYAQHAAAIADLKAQQKEVFEALFNKFGFSSKEHKEQIKAIKKSFNLYVKQTASEEKAIFDEAFELASI